MLGTVVERPVMSWLSQIIQSEYTASTEAIATRAINALAPQVVTAQSESGIPVIKFTTTLTPQWLVRRGVVQCDQAEDGRSCSRLKHRRGRSRTQEGMRGRPGHEPTHEHGTFAISCESSDSILTNWCFSRCRGAVRLGRGRWTHSSSCLNPSLPPFLRRPRFPQRALQPTSPGRAASTAIPSPR